MIAIFFKQNVSSDPCDDLFEGLTYQLRNMGKEPITTANIRELFIAYAVAEQSKLKVSTLFKFKEDIQ